ncbi:MAG: HNH endonuclease [Gammaproteobacteria bacterium]|nr:HNH endonuclease [Gammaproteobacteria bacterium]
MLNSAPLTVLRLDVTGRPLSWIHWEEAACYYAKELVAWEVGENNMLVRGGCSRFTGQQSSLKVNSIIAVHGTLNHKYYGIHPPHLSNRELFRRDGHLCMYCGQRFSDGDLTRDHIIPKAQNGADRWTNVVAACKRCNVAKGARTPEQAGMPLLAVPFVPNPAEYLALLNRKILADQMQFLKKQFRHDRLLDLK